MRVNPTLVKQLARRVCVTGLPLWRHMVSVGTAAAGSSRITVTRVKLSPSQIKQAIAEFAAKDSSYKAYLDLQENRNLPKQLGSLLQLLNVNDDPLIIEADIVTVRLLATVRLQNQRATSLNNMLSEARSAFRLLFGRCLLPGITDAASTVKVDGETLRIHLQSPVPDGAVTYFSGAMQARGNLTREPRGGIRTYEVFQLHLVYAWHVLLRELRELTKWCALYHEKTVQMIENC